MKHKMPSQCSICRMWTTTTICDVCSKNYAADKPRCIKCALSIPEVATHAQDKLLCGKCLQAKHLPHIDACFAAVSYAFPWQDCINNFKFNNQIGYSDVLARIMLSKTLLLHALSHSDIVIPMPLHKSRLAQRGYNQSLLLARSLCKQVRTLTTVSNKQCLLKSKCLKRIRATAVQSQLPLNRRKSNVHKAFAVPENKQEIIYDQRVALIDDVLTTGASANAAASALKKAGVQTVTVFIFARTEKFDV